MFTGLVEKIGSLDAIEKSGDSWVLTVGHDPWDTPLVAGESVAVQGACLTVLKPDVSDLRRNRTPFGDQPRERQFVCNVLDETFARTNLASKPRGSALNLERALRFGDRLGGHLVAGHVDGVGQVVALDVEGSDRILRVRCDMALTTEIVLKGSVALDGVSLTVTAVGRETFETHIIPTTWSETTLGQLAVGSTLNIETDLLGKFIHKQLQQPAKEGGLDWDDLARAGYL